MRRATGEARDVGAPGSVAFLFAGVGDEYPNMGRGLYESEPHFRATVDHCAEVLLPSLGVDLRELLYPGVAPVATHGGKMDLRAMLRRDGPADASTRRMHRTLFAQASLFVTEYALARLWMRRGVVPDAVIGHSLGEWTAAAVADVMPLDDALRLVAARSHAVEALPPGGMLAIPLPEADVRRALPADIDVATVNSPGLVVVAGPEDAITALDNELALGGVLCRRLPVQRAFHSRMMAPAMPSVAAALEGIRLSPPSIPVVSTVTGTWLRDAEATDPAYWSGHLCATVRFADAATLIADGGRRILLEIGPGLTLGTFARQCGAAGRSANAAIASMRHSYEGADDVAFLGAAHRRLAEGIDSESRSEARALGPAESVIARLWSELLGVTTIGPDDDFLRLGGDSLRSTRLVSRLRDAFGVELPLRAVFGARTVAGQAALVEAALVAELEAMPDEDVEHMR